MAKIKEKRLEIRLTERMKTDIGRAARDYGITPSKLMRALFQQFKENEWKPRR